MKNIYYFLAIVLVVNILSCGNKGPEPVSEWDSIQPNKYYDTDILDSIPIYGKWEVISTSGGKMGDGYDKDFDYLLVKPNAIFGILRNDSLLTTGKIVIPPNTSQIPLISFDAEKTTDILLLLSNINYRVEFKSDTLNLFAGCCDNFNTHFKKVK